MHKTIECPISVHARSDIPKVAVIDHDTSWTYSELNRLVYACQSHLKQFKQSTICWVPLGNVYDIALFWALFRQGKIGFPLSFRLPKERRQNTISSLENTLYIDDIRSFFSEFEKHSDDVKQVNELKQIIELDRIATYLHTSGTSRAPKIAVHRYANHHFSASAALYNSPMIEGDRALLNLPLFHVGGLGTLFRAWNAGATIVLLDKHVSFQAQLERDSISHVSLVPTQLKRWLDDVSFSCPASLQVVLLGGAPISDSLLNRALDMRIPLMRTYGLTELSSQVTATSLDASNDDLRSSGEVLCDHELMLASDGEILLKGPTLFCGYLDEAGIDPSVDGHGWFRTGDIGHIDTYSRLYIDGRKDRMFISGGENINPEEIESILLSFDGIERALVVSMRHEEFGDVPIAYIETTRALSGLFVDDIRTFLRSKIESFKIPVQFLPFDQSPVSHMTWKSA